MKLENGMEEQVFCVRLLHVCPGTSLVRFAFMLVLANNKLLTMTPTNDEDDDTSMTNRNNCHHHQHKRKCWWGSLILRTSFAFVFRLDVMRTTTTTSSDHRAPSDLEPLNQPTFNCFCFSCTRHSRHPTLLLLFTQAVVLSWEMGYFSGTFGGFQAVRAGFWALSGFWSGGEFERKLFVVCCCFVVDSARQMVMDG